MLIIKKIVRVLRQTLLWVEDHYCPSRTHANLWFNTALLGYNFLHNLCGTNVPYEFLWTYIVYSGKALWGNRGFGSKNFCIKKTMN